MYDMKNDPKQFKNLVTDPQHKPTLDTLLAKLDEKLKKMK